MKTLTNTQKTYVSAAVLIVAILIGWWLITERPVAGPDSTGAVATVVDAFGAHMHLVSLLAPEPELSASLDAAYGPFVTPELLASWKANPEAALGRQTSSPSPERIEIGTIDRNDDGTYTALGSVIEIADEMAVAMYPIALTLEERNGTWLIREASKGTYVALPERRVLEGTHICLPHVDTDGPQTLECRLGLKADDGTNYALDIQPLEGTDQVGALDHESRIRVEGTFVPIENLSASFWQTYDVEGVIRVTALTEL